MPYLSKSVYVDVDIDFEVNDVLEFIESASTEDKKKIQQALDGTHKLPDTPFYIPVLMRGSAAQLIALGQLVELVDTLGVEEMVQRLKG